MESLDVGWVTGDGNDVRSLLGALPGICDSISE